VRALILQFEDFNPPSHLGTYLSRQGIAWDVVHMNAPHERIALHSYDVLVALGGAMCANEVETYPFLVEAMDAMRAAVRRDVPYLGICLGGQLLAKALGAEVRRNDALEVGRIEVALSSQAASDPLLRGLSSVVQTVQFHEDTFAVPAGGALLGSSPGCATQIVRCAPRAYALQFHPEASAEDFALWVDHAYQEAPGAGTRGAALVDDVKRHDALIRAHAGALFSNFIALSC
jgi:GMP synthase (glutamine-hydrolysing)